MDNLSINLDEAVREIEYAYNHTPFFTDHLNDFGLKPSDIRTHEDLLKIPYTSKKHYRKNFPAKVLSEGFSINDQRLYRTQSSGTAGERLVTLEVGIFFLGRAKDTLTVYPEIESVFFDAPRRHIRYAAPNCSDVECANPNSTAADRTLTDGTLVLSVYHDMLTTTEEILENNIKEIEEYQPKMYYIDSTHLAFLTRYMKKVGYTPPKAPILSSYTASTQISRRQIKEVFGADTPYAEFVSMSEIGWVALECEHGNMHINNKSYYLEFIRENRRAEPGELADLYITTIDNGCTPHIRYKTGDIYRLLDIDCECGHPFPVVQMEGRLQNFIYQNNEVVLTPRQLDDIIGAPEWMDLYKFRQLSEQDFTLDYISNEKYEPNNEQYIIEALKEKLGTNINLKIEKTNYIPTERSGKFLSCISDVGMQLYKQGYSL